MLENTITKNPSTTEPQESIQVNRHVHLLKLEKKLELQIYLLRSSPDFEPGQKQYRRRDLLDFIKKRRGNIHPSTQASVISTKKPGKHPPRHYPGTSRLEQHLPRCTAPTDLLRWTEELPISWDPLELTSATAEVSLLGFFKGFSRFFKVFLKVF